MAAKRPKRNTWDDYFQKMADLVATRSRDSSQVGCVIVGEDNVVLATGYNGLPRRVADRDTRLENDEKLCWTVHAEVNAVCNAARVGTSLNGGTVYVTKFPCAGCAGALIQAGAKRVVCDGEKFWKNDPTGDDGRRSYRMLSEAGVAVLAPHIEIGEMQEQEA